MKKYFYLFFLPLYFGLTACGDSDDDDITQDPVEEQLSKLSEGTKKFIGYWHNNNGSYDFKFFADMTCICYDNDGGAPVYGEWSYDENVKLLSTTIGAYQWTITLSTDNSWAGLGLGTNNAGAVSFVRSDMYHIFNCFLKPYTWRSDDNNKISFKPSKNMKYNEDGVEGYYDSYGNGYEWGHLNDEFISNLQLSRYMHYISIRIDNFKMSNDSFSATINQHGSVGELIQGNHHTLDEYNWTFSGKMTISNVSKTNKQSDARMTITGTYNVPGINKKYELNIEYAIADNAS